MRSSCLGASTKDNPEVANGFVPTPRRFRTRWFAHADRWFSRLVRFLGALHEGFWLGCLSADDLNAITEDHFDQSRFYASAEHNLSGFFAWETPLIKRYFHSESRVLVAGAGGGREVLALRRHGFDAEGFECSLSLVQASRQIFDELGEAKHVVHCPPDCVPGGPPLYNGLVVGWTTYTHIPIKMRRILFLQSLRERALPHSPVLLSFFTRRIDSLDDAIVYRTARTFQFLVRSRKEPLEKGDRINFARYVRLFTRDELEEELRAAGFQLAHYHDVEKWGYAIGIAD